MRNYKYYLVFLILVIISSVAAIFTRYSYKSTEDLLSTINNQGYEVSPIETTKWTLDADVDLIVKIKIDKVIKYHNGYMAYEASVIETIYQKEPEDYNMLTLLEPLYISSKLNHIISLVPGHIPLRTQNEYTLLLNKVVVPTNSLFKYNQPVYQLASFDNTIDINHSKSFSKLIKIEPSNSLILDSLININEIDDNIEFVFSSETVYESAVKFQQEIIRTYNLRP